ncbi:DEKNAAC103505 [Brettanomyces naardenensis]|uniref:Magnesium transporter n=1 Tax=Brettanomyces naardenensis TaxID=13370 RepID=A0A448YNA8_BRENA|nr:DEKNAAC103505 [Brettanomyces naardenensis]
MFIKNMSEKLRNDNNDKLHYEIRALESIFIDMLENLNSEMKVHVNIVNGILKELEDEVDLAKLKYLLIVSKKLQQFQQKATLIRDLIDELLDQDDELAELYLTEKKEGLPRSTHDHQEVELLLESYSLHCDAIVQTVENSISDVKTTEEIINIILDSNRNDLMLLGLRFSAGLMCFGSLMFPAAVYGMNLMNFFEKDGVFFPVVMGGSVAVMWLLFRGALKRLHRLTKIQLMKQ